MERIEEIKKRLSEMATPGPWYFRHGNGSLILDKDGIIVDEPLHAMDAIFIANAPTDIDYLLNALEVERSVSKDLLHRGQDIQQENQRLRGALQNIMEIAKIDGNRIVDNCYIVARQALDKAGK